MKLRGTIGAVAHSLILVWASAPGLVAAQRIPSPYGYLEAGQEAGPFVGHLSADGGTFGLGPKGGSLVGGRYGVEISGPFALEAVTSYFPTTRDVIDPRRLANDRVVDEVDVALVIVEARIRFSLVGRRAWRGLSPYFMVGGGIGFDIEGDQAGDELVAVDHRFDFGTEFLGALGGGLRLMLGERLLVRGEAHLTLWQLETPEGFQDPELELGAVPTGEWVNNRALVVGLSYRF